MAAPLPPFLVAVVARRSSWCRPRRVPWGGRDARRGAPTALRLSTRSRSRRPPSRCRSACRWRGSSLRFPGRSPLRVVVLPVVLPPVVGIVLQALGPGIWLARRPRDPADSSSRPRSCSSLATEGGPRTRRPHERAAAPGGSSCTSPGDLPTMRRVTAGAVTWAAPWVSSAPRCVRRQPRRTDTDVALPCTRLARSSGAVLLSPTWSAVARLVAPEAG